MALLISKYGYGQPCHGGFTAKNTRLLQILLIDYHVKMEREERLWHQWKRYRVPFTHAHIIVFQLLHMYRFVTTVST